mmetsp:Transcript_15130/g.25877  ORF Transcript_15130/g.25877 Transcript_15130/m.25877 type:complete len:82 (+) Transcript_15130:1074-1319(+)
MLSVIIGGIQLLIIYFSLNGNGDFLRNCSGILQVVFEGEIIFGRRPGICKLDSGQRGGGPLCYQKPSQREGGIGRNGGIFV